MTWKPICLAELEALMERDLDACPQEERAYFARVAFAPEKWSQSPMGDMGGGFWAVAVDGDRVLWYNDIEDGFNVSHFVLRGEIPRDAYWCNQSALGPMLSALRRAAVPRWSPPQPLPGI
jgi:hypothetical protein